MNESERLENIHTIAGEKLKKTFSLERVNPKHPLPERSKRVLGLIRIDGNVFSAKEFLRVLLLEVSIAGVRGVRTIFLGPQVGLDLPIFSSEAILMGKKRIFFLDVQRRGGYDKHDDTALYKRLLAIKDGYPELFTKPLQQTGEVLATFSPAACYMETTRDMDGKAIELIHKYLDVYMELARNASPLTGDALDQANLDYDKYTYTVVDHDPAAKIYRILFGKKGGSERVLDLFFAC
jgi:hypothetical protein